MASPKSGSEVPADAPEDPAEALEATSTDPGELSQIHERNRQIEEGKIDSNAADPMSNPGSGGDSEDTKMSWISVELQDADGKPVVGEPFYVIFSNNSRVDDVTHDDGKCKIDQVPPGSVKIDFSNIDKREWKPK